MDLNHASLSKAGLRVDRSEEIEQKIRCLQSRDPRLRAEAARRLGDLHAGRDALLKVLDDPNSYVRTAAAQALGFTPEDAVTPELIEALLATIDDANDFVCSAAITSLGRLKAENSRSEIIDCLEDPNPHIVSAAMIALARLGPPEVAERLVGYLDSENWHLRAAAARAMGMLDYQPAGPKLAARLEEALKLPRDQRADVIVIHLISAITALKVQAAAPLLIETAQNEVGLRSRAVEALVALKSEAAAPVLAKMLADPSHRLREGLIRLMAETRFEAGLPLIRPFLKDTNVYLRSAALEAVAKMKDTASLGQVRWMCAQDPNPFVRVKALNVLVLLAGNEAVPDLLSLAGDVNTYLRQSVAVQLAHLENLPRAVGNVLERMAVEDPDEEVRQAARQALESHQFEPAAAELEEAPARAGIVLPASMQSEAQVLLALLERWQAALPELAGCQDLNDIAETDRALSRLIQILENAGGS